MKRIFLFVLTLLLFFNVFVSANITVNFNLKGKRQSCFPSAARKIIPKLRDNQDNGDNLKVVVWGIGEDGLTQRCWNFYNNNVFKQLNANFADCTCFFYDLSAWKGLQDGAVNLLEKMSPQTVISDYPGFKLEDLYSKNFFEYITTLKLDDPTGSYFEWILKNRSFIWRLSMDRKNTGLLLEETALRDAEIFHDLLKEKAERCYSALQYLEGVFIIKELIRISLEQEEKKLNILFLLPQWECEYYYDTEKLPMECYSFQQDLNVVLKWEFPWLDFDAVNVNVSFASFEYIHNGCKRPYIFIAGDELVIKKE